ncbi:uncharacterized protein [Chlorocebus sabaeus]|uniref:uncharacterized protein n=1 Tax=Chlorocebus sabaeus TaxID=60711 RepID=UPI003BFA1289
MTNLAAHKGGLFTTVTPGDHACTHLAEDNSLLIPGAAGPAANFRIQVGSPRPNSTPPRHRRSLQVQGFPPPRRSRPLKVSLTRPGRCSPRSIPPHPGAPRKRCDPRPAVVSPPPDAAPAPTCGAPGISEVPNQSLPAHPRVLSTRDAAPPAGTPPTCGAIPTSAAHLTASAAPTYDDPGVGAPAHSRPPPAPAPFPAPSHAPAPAAPPVRSGPARHRPLALGRGGAAVPTPARAGRVHIAYCAPGLAAPLDLLAMDTDDSQAPKGSLRKFLEHLSGAGKAVGVLTRGEDAQGPPRRPPRTRRTRKRGLRDVSGAAARALGFPCPAMWKRLSRRDPSLGPRRGRARRTFNIEEPEVVETARPRPRVHVRAPVPGRWSAPGRAAPGGCVERRGWRISSRFGTAHCTRMEREWAPALGPGNLPFALERAGRHGCCMLGRCQRRPARRERLRDARPVVSMRPGPDIRTPRAPRASSAASLGPAPPPPRDTPVAAPGPAPQPAPQRPGKCSGVSFLVKGPQHQRSSCRVGFSEKEKVMQQRMGLEKLGE